MVQPQLLSNGRQHGVSGAAHDAGVHAVLHMTCAPAAPPVPAMLAGRSPAIPPVPPDAPLDPAPPRLAAPPEPALPDAPAAAAPPRFDLPPEPAVATEPPARPPAFESLPARPPVAAPTAERSGVSPATPPLAAAVPTASRSIEPFAPASSVLRVGMSFAAAQSWQTENSPPSGSRGSAAQTRAPWVPVSVQVQAVMSPIRLQRSSVRTPPVAPALLPEFGGVADLVPTMLPLRRWLWSSNVPS